MYGTGRHIHSAPSQSKVNEHTRQLLAAPKPRPWTQERNTNEIFTVESHVHKHFLWAAMFLVVLGTTVAFAVDDILESLARHSFVTVDSQNLWPLLSELGAREEDAVAAAQLWSEAKPQTDEHGADIYAYKGTLTSFFDMNTSATHFNSIRSKGEDSTRYPGYVVEHIDPTTVNGESASYYRIHKSWPRGSENNSVVMAIHRLIFELLASRPNSRGVFEAMFSAFRVRSSAMELGDPGPEGIHQDSAEVNHE